MGNPKGGPGPLGKYVQHTDHILQATRDYINGGWKQVGATPSHWGLARYICKQGVITITRTTLHAWANDAEGHEEFAELWGCLKDEALCVIENGGLTKQFDSGMSRRMMSHYGVSEKTDIDHTHRVVDDGSNEW